MRDTKSSLFNQKDVTDSGSGGRDQENYMHLSKSDVEIMEIERHNKSIQQEKDVMLSKIKSAYRGSEGAGEMLVDTLRIIEDYFATKLK